jgi:Family of unknown function (DUF5990)
MVNTPPKSLTIRLVFTSMPETPADEGQLDVGMQDKAQVVHPGRMLKNGTMIFECTVEARLDASTGEPSYRGPFVQGTAQARFLYLSWKRKTQSASPWYWRVKVPLTGITWKRASSLKSNEVIEANITGRRPHATEPIVWKRSADVGASDNQHFHY